MKVLTAAEMREIDRRTIEAGVPGLILMENAGSRCVEMLAERYAPLGEQRIVVVCGKGNNGGDGLVIARQLAVRFAPRALDVVLVEEASEFRGDAAANYRMLEVVGVEVHREFTPRLRASTLVVDAVLGTGLNGPARGAALEWIRRINNDFPLARVVSVDVPSGLHADGESVRAELTVTFTAPKVEQVVAPGCDRVGELKVVGIGTPARMLEDDPALWLHLTEPGEFRGLFGARARGGHKGDYGHVLVVGGASGKGGAAAMSGWAALKAGAGLVTVATSEEERRTVTALAPELMTQGLEEDAGDKDVIAIGPGLGRAPEMVGLAQRLFAQSALAVVMDADGLNALAGTAFQGPGPLRVLTPHPGEMARLSGMTTAAVQAERVEVARRFARGRNVVLVLKGQRTLIALPDGRVWINPTGTPAMATAGSGDVLTGLLAGLLGQWPERWREAVLAAVWLHGRAGELAAAELGEAAVTATELIRYLPAAVREVRG